MGKPGLLQALRELEGSRGTPFTYILELQSGVYYTDSSTDFEARFRDHEAGTACRTTRIDPPVGVLWIEIQADFSVARARESQIKKWSRAKKEALIAGDCTRLRRLSKSRD
jgi:putative endonuclease